MSSDAKSAGAHIEAEITALRPEEGGRNVPMFDGYRPHHDFGLGTQTDAQHQYVGRDRLLPGETGRAVLTFFWPEYLKGRLLEGQSFTVQEGSRIVGRGKILKVLDETLRDGA